MIGSGPPTFSLMCGEAVPGSQTMSCSVGGSGPLFTPRKWRGLLNENKGERVILAVAVNDKFSKTGYFFLYLPLYDSELSPKHNLAIGSKAHRACWGHHPALHFKVVSKVASNTTQLSK